MRSKQLRVLYADGDSRADGEVIQLIRAVCGDCTIIAAKDGANAIDEFRKGPFDLVVLDAWIPESNGFEICRKIREIDQQVPIIFYAVLAGSNAKGFAERAGATAFHTSEEPAEFIKSVAEALRISENVPI